jgi:hypothetical protein
MRACAVKAAAALPERDSMHYSSDSARRPGALAK